MSITNCVKLITIEYQPVIKYITINNCPIIKLDSLPALTVAIVNCTSLTSLGSLPKAIVFRCENCAISTLPEMPVVKNIRIDKTPIAAVPSLLTVRIFIYKNSILTTFPTMPRAIDINLSGSLKLINIDAQPMVNVLSVMGCIELQSLPEMNAIISLDICKCNVQVPIYKTLESIYISKIHNTIFTSQPNLSLVFTDTTEPAPTSWKKTKSYYWRINDKYDLSDRHEKCSDALDFEGGIMLDFEGGIMSLE